MKPRQDVGSSGIAGALAFIFQVMLDRELYNFDQLSSALSVAIVFGAGYMADARQKSLAMLVAVPVAVLVSALVGMFLGTSIEQSIVSGALSSLVVALVGYFGRPVDPDIPPPATR